jgi:hypothetical protein
MDDVRAAEHELYVRRWYLVSVGLIGAGRDSAEADEARQRAALEYPVLLSDLEQRSEYHDGWLAGAHQALRWVLGDGERIDDASADT